MERLMCIFNDEKYTQYLETINENEKTRIFCRHSLQHFLDVARISYIINLEEDLGYSKELIYVASFLHDIGRGKLNSETGDHEIDSWELAEDILMKYDFYDNEISIIKQAILGHRKDDDKGFANLIYRGDKLSRDCYNCKAEPECYWSKEKKNKNIKY